MIQQGTYTVGSGGDYALLSAALADIGGRNLGSAILGNIELVLISNIVEPVGIYSTSPIYLSNQQFGLTDSYTLTIRSALSSNGSPIGGYKVTSPYCGLYGIQGLANSRFTIDDVMFDITDANGFFDINAIASGPSTAYRYVFKNLRIKSNSYISIGMIASGSLYTNYAEWFNCKLWARTGIQISQNYFNSNVALQNWKFENCVFAATSGTPNECVWLTGSGSQAGSAGTYFRNCVFLTNNSSQNAVRIQSSAQNSYWAAHFSDCARNAGSDSVLTWEYSSFDANTELLSLSDSNANFLNLNHQSPLFTAGSASGLTLLTNSYAAPLPIGIYYAEPIVGNSNPSSFSIRAPTVSGIGYRSPNRSQLLPGAGASISHARILAAYRNAEQARQLHNMIQADL